MIRASLGVTSLLSDKLSLAIFILNGHQANNKKYYPLAGNAENAGNPKESDMLSRNKDYELPAFPARDIFFAFSA